jgi:uncharacterized protein (DUF58 family)
VSFLRDLYLGSRLFWALAAIAVVAALGYAVPVLLAVAQVATVALAAGLIADTVVLWRRGRLTARREVSERLSMGDDNTVVATITSTYPFAVGVRVVDEAPVEFQLRDLRFDARVGAGETARFSYTLRPTVRGSYAFGDVLAYATGPLGLAMRRFRSEAAREVAVYPSFVQMERYAFLATSNRLAEAGVKRIRRLGHSMEFDQVREYVAGDDPRLVNWKATARRADLMMNQYREERSQPVYVLLDMGRTMRSPFEEMTLLDYAINAGLVLLNTALLKGDRAGLITFGNEVETVVPAERRSAQRYRLVEALYHQKTRFLEASYEALHAAVRRHVTGRALLVLFTNFETVEGMQRQLRSLRALARRHVVVAVFFENVGLEALRQRPAADVEEVYVKAVVEKLDAEKRQIVRELQRHGIQAVLTRPEAVTVEALNRYLEIKARGML